MNYVSFGAESEFNLQRLTEEPVLFASVSWVSLGKKAASKVKHSQFEAPPTNGVFYGQKYNVS